jgi:hypothetical protein
MKKNLFFLLDIIVIAFISVACTDDESFTISNSATLSFSVDTLSIDTVFANISSPQKDFYIYNHGTKGIKITSARLENGNAAGFLVNVDGRFLNSTSGYKVNDFEIRKGDSLRVFVKLLAHGGNSLEPQAISDNLIFTLESGEEQHVTLKAWTWNANMLKNLNIKSDTTFSTERPIVVCGGITVDSAATLTLAAGTKLYFQSNAGMDIYGRIVSSGTANENVILRGARLDKMFPYLPFDNVSGQWKGLTLHSSSYKNIMTYTDLHSANNGIQIDSSDVNKLKLEMNSSTVHNCQGYGIMALNSYILLTNCQISNTLNDCLYVEGGRADINACTLAQFYPFDSMRGYSLHFVTNSLHILQQMICRNSLITGYNEDELLGESTKNDTLKNYAFDYCLIRTPKPTTSDSLHFTNVIFENPKDTITGGEKHFKKIDTENLRYDFQLDSISPAIDKASPFTSPKNDRNGNNRDTKPDIGAYERNKS